MPPAPPSHTAQGENPNNSNRRWCTTGHHWVALNEFGDRATCARCRAIARQHQLQNMPAPNPGPVPDPPAIDPFLAVSPEDKKLLLRN